MNLLIRFIKYLDYLNKFMNSIINIWIIWNFQKYIKLNLKIY